MHVVSGLIIALLGFTHHAVAQAQAVVDCDRTEVRNANDGYPSGPELAQSIEANNTISTLCGWSRPQFPNTAAIDDGHLLLSVTPNSPNASFVGCDTAFENIINTCIVPGTYYGGSLDQDGVIYEITNVVYPDNPINATALSVNMTGLLQQAGNAIDAYLAVAQFDEPTSNEAAEAALTYTENAFTGAEAANLGSLQDALSDVDADIELAQSASNQSDLVNTLNKLSSDWATVEQTAESEGLWPPNASNTNTSSPAIVGSATAVSTAAASTGTGSASSTGSAPSTGTGVPSYGDGGYGYGYGYRMSRQRRTDNEAAQPDAPEKFKPCNPRWCPGRK